MATDPNDPALSNRHKGHAIEQLAEHWLSQQGLTLVERNFTLRGGEIDLIMWQDDVLVFVEVRYRQDSGHGSGAESITRAKQNKIRRTAESYLQQHFGNRPPFCRIDVLSACGSAVLAGRGEPVAIDGIRNACACQPGFHYDSRVTVTEFRRAPSLHWPFWCQHRNQNAGR